MSFKKGEYKLDRKELIKYFYEVVVSKNMLDELPKYISENCVQRAGEKTFLIGIDGMKQHLLALKKTYPDYTMKIIRQYVADDYVISEFIMRGTHKGDFIGITPTNKILEITGVDIDKVVDGKIVEHGGAANTFETFFEHHLIKPV
ncbi:ester cyclase [Enterocloster clostridioformis]|uniref:ester cyclase n=1 Tax=Enterocloster clostridioformis TaxID=1531 RepID=UPI003A7F1855